MIAVLLAVGSFVFPEDSAAGSDAFSVALSAGLSAIIEISIRMELEGVSNGRLEMMKSGNYQ